MKDSYRLIQQLLVHLVLFLKVPVELLDLLYATFSSDNGSDSLLNGCLLVFKVFYLLRYNGQILWRGQPIYTIEKDCTMIVWDQEPVPGLQKLLLKIVDHVSSDMLCETLRLQGPYTSTLGLSSLL